MFDTVSWKYSSSLSSSSPEFAGPLYTDPDCDSGRRKELLVLLLRLPPILSSVGILMVGKVKRVCCQSFILHQFSFLSFLSLTFIPFCKVFLLRGFCFRILSTRMVERTEINILTSTVSSPVHWMESGDWRLRDLLAAFIPWVLRKRKVPEVHHLLLSNKGKAIMACVKCSQWYHFIEIAAASSIQEIFLHKGGQEN